MFLLKSANYGAFSLSEWHIFSLTFPVIDTVASLIFRLTSEHIGDHLENSQCAQFLEFLCYALLFLFLAHSPTKYLLVQNE